jgi:hypothetical protein
MTNRILARVNAGLLSRGPSGSGPLLDAQIPDTYNPPAALLIEG